MILVLVLGGGLGWLADLARRAHSQRDAVRAIRKADGVAWYDWGYKSGERPSSWKGEPWAPKWLVERLGEDYFGRVVAVHQYGEFIRTPKFTDEDMVHVGRLEGLVELKLIGSSITDAGLAHLKGLTNLERIRLVDSAVTDAGLAYLKDLPRLKVLSLYGGNFTDAGLLYLNGLSSLQDLALSNTKVTGAGLASLKGLASLQTLEISRNSRSPMLAWSISRN